LCSDQNFIGQARIERLKSEADQSAFLCFFAMTDPRSLVDEKDVAREPPEPRAEPMEADQAQEALDEVQGMLAID